MIVIRRKLSILSLLLAAACVGAAAQDDAQPPNALSIAVGKSVIVNSAQMIERVSVGLGEVAEATVITPQEVLVNGKAAGSTSLIIWQQGGGKLFFDVNVKPNRFVSDSKADSVRREINKELPGQHIAVSFDNDVFYLRGTAADMTSALRALSIASSAGRVVNLMYVTAPPAEPQILLRVRIASLDRTKSMQLGVNLFSTGATNTIGSSGTGQYQGPGLPPNPILNNAINPFVLSSLLNLFLFRPDLKLGATIQDLETKGVLQTLAEPDVMAKNGKQASFLAGGEFPYPVFQGGTGIGTGAITIQFREFGVRLNFIPTITPQGTIRLQVAPEVSALDFANALTIQGFNIPALTTRKVKTEVELQDGQTFAIGGLLDKRVTETFQKMPFIGDIPVLGKLFQSKNVNRQNTELIVIVTPEIVRPIPQGAPTPDLKFATPFLDSENDKLIKGSGGAAINGPAPVKPPAASIPFEGMVRSLAPEQPLVVEDNGTGKGSMGTPLQSDSPTVPATGNAPPSTPPNP